MTDATSARLRPLADTSPSAVVAGFIAMLTGYTSSLVLMFQAGQAAGLTAGQISSWIWALSIGMALCCIDSGELDAASEAARVWAQLQPGDAEAARLNAQLESQRQYDCGVALEAEGRHQEACAAWRVSWAPRSGSGGASRSRPKCSAARASSCSGRVAWQFARDYAGRIEA